MTTATHWDSVYRRRQPTDVSWYEPIPYKSLELIAQSGLEKGRRIADIGGGASALVDNLAERGYTSLVLVDISATAIEVTRSRLGEKAEAVEFVVGDARRSLDLDPVRLWHDRAVFHFLTDPDDRRSYTKAMQSQLAPNAFAVIAAFDANGPPQCSNLPVQRYSASDLSAEFPFMTVIAAESHDHTTPDGRVQPFTYLLMQAT